jgi:alcohol dehydrogenase (NADP+)
MPSVKAYAAHDPLTPLAPYTFNRRQARPHDVVIDIHFCGVCHSDIHTVRNEWGQAHFPLVPGHEIIGKVAAVGQAVQKFKVGQTVGVGCMVDSCRTCANCSQGLEQYCEQGFTGTYNSQSRDGSEITQGGYSTQIVVDEAFVLRIPEGMDLAKTAPLLCAGITTYSALRANTNIQAGQKVGVIGLGGLGHMGVKLAHAMGADVYVFTTSAHKVQAARDLGAIDAIISSDPATLAQHLASFDFLLDTVAAPHDLNQFLALLKTNGKLCLVGASPQPFPIVGFSLIRGRKNLCGSLIGGIAETQEMLDFCHAHQITAEIELLPVAAVNTAYERMLKNEVKYRFVLDLKSLQTT